MVLPLLPATAFWLMKRALFARRDEMLAALRLDGLQARIATRENMLSSVRFR
jgi:uncharacterized membrane protein YbaN (DUF454 family)